MKIKSLIVLILVLSCALRFFSLSKNPSSLYWDEASLGWNSMKILESGKDEYGIPHPLTLKSFGDYKPALYAYFSLIPIKVFGLNEFSVRFVSAFLGSLLPLAIFLILKKTFPSGKIAILAAFLTSISPWMVQMSRGAFEANLGLNIIVWGVVILFYATNILAESLGILAILSSVYAYHANKFFAPVTILLYFLLIVTRNKSKSIFKLLFFIPFFGLFLFPFMKSLFLGYGLNRFGAVSSGSVNYLLNLLSHFNFDFLFLNADYNMRHHVFGFGLFYLFESVFLLVGIFILIKKFKQRWLFIGLFILSLIPSSVSLDVPHAIRSILSFPFFVCLIALGISFLAKNKVMKIIFVLGYFYILVFSFNARFVQYPVESSADWQYGYKQVAEYLFKEITYEKYDKIIMTSAYDEPYIYMLFYSNGKFINFVNPGNANLSFDKFEFKKINFEEEKNKKNTLIIGTEQEIKTNNVLKTIYYPNGKVAFKIL